MLDSLFAYSLLSCLSLYSLSFTSIPTYHRITLYKAEEEVVVKAGGDRVGEIESPESW